MIDRKAGELREDGHVFHCYYTTKAGIRREHWLSPESWAKKQVNRRDTANKWARNKRATDPDFRLKQNEYSKHYMKKQRDTNPAVFMFRGAKTRARKSGLAFSITIEDVVVPEYCPVLGLKLESVGYAAASSPSLDRIDNSKGYVKGNVIVVSLRANQLKRDASLDELRRITRFYETLDVLTSK